MPIFQLKKSEKFFLSHVFKDFEPLHLKNIAPVGGAGGYRTTYHPSLQKIIK